MKKKINKNKNLDFSTSIIRNVLKLVHLEVTDETFHLVLQIFKFGIVGVVATIIDFIFLYLYTLVLKLLICSLY